MKDYLRDGWSWVHLFGSCLLALFIFQFVIKDERAFISAFFVGFLWEVADEINKRLKLGWWFFDLRGFDKRDMVMNLVGIVLALCFWFDVGYMAVDMLRYLFS